MSPGYETGLSLRYYSNIMGKWIVVYHSDDFSPFGPTCFHIKFANRKTMESHLRVDLIHSTMDEVTEMWANLFVFKGDVTVGDNKMFLVTKEGKIYDILPQWMILKLKGDCFCAWSCKQAGTMMQPSAYVACKSGDFDPSVVEELVEDLGEEVGIDASQLVPTQAHLC